MLFIGLIRRLPPAASTDGRAVVRFWTNSSGMILCCDRSTADCFGLDASELVGQPFSNLCTDVEAVSRYYSQLSVSLAAMHTSTSAGSSLLFATMIRMR
jgi:hypothetical protein